MFVGLPPPSVSSKARHQSLHISLKNINTVDINIKLHENGTGCPLGEWALVKEHRIKQQVKGIKECVVEYRGSWVDLTKVAAGVCLFCGFVERFALNRKLFRLADQIIQLLAAHQNLLDCVPQNNFRLVKVFLHLGQRIGLSGVLVFGDVARKLCEIDSLFGAVGPLVAGDLRVELVHDLR